MGTCLSGGTSKKLNGGMCLMKTSVVERETDKPEIVANTTARNEKSAWSYPRIDFSSSDFPTSIYLPDGEEKYLSPSSSTKQKTTTKGGGGDVDDDPHRTATTKKKLEYFLNCDEKIISEKIFGDTDDEKTKTKFHLVDDLNDLNLDKLSARKSDGQPTISTARKIMQKQHFYDSSKVPLKWPGEYGNIIVAPPNKTINCINNLNSALNFDGKTNSQGQNRRNCVGEDRNSNVSCPTAVALKSCVAVASSSCCGFNNFDRNVKNSSTRSSSSSSSNYNYCDSREKRPSYSKCSSSWSNSTDSSRILTNFASDLNEIDVSPTTIGAETTTNERFYQTSDHNESAKNNFYTTETLKSTAILNSSSIVDDRRAEKCSVGSGPSSPDVVKTTNFRRS